MAEITEIGIDTDALARDVEAMRGTLSSIRAEMDGMYEAYRVLDTMWDGPANEGFRQQFRRDNADMEEICDTVQTLLRCMELSGRRYRNSENCVRGILEAIRI